MGCLSAGRSGSNREHTAVRNSLSFNHLGLNAYQIQLAFLMLQPVCAQCRKHITYLFPSVCPSISVHSFDHLICFTVSGCSFESAEPSIAGWMHATPSLWQPSLQSTSMDRELLQHDLSTKPTSPPVVSNS
jgi:hypothetical protein